MWGGGLLIYTYRGDLGRLLYIHIQLGDLGVIKHTLLWANVMYCIVLLEQCILLNFLSFRWCIKWSHTFHIIMRPLQSNQNTVKQSRTEWNQVEQSQTKSNCNNLFPFDFVTVFDLVRLCSQAKSNQSRTKNGENDRHWTGSNTVEHSRTQSNTVEHSRTQSNCNNFFWFDFVWLCSTWFDSVRLCLTLFDCVLVRLKGSS